MEETVSNAVEEVKNASEEDLKKVIEQHFEQVRTQGMHIGAQFLSAAVYSAIEKNLKNGKNSSLRDYQRAIKRVVEIVSIHLKTEQNDLETDEPAQEEEES